MSYMCVCIQSSAPRTYLSAFLYTFVDRTEPHYFAFGPVSIVFRVHPDQVYCF